MLNETVKVIDLNKEIDAKVIINQYNCLFIINKI